MKKLIIALLIFLIYFLAGIYFIHDYGINWDEPAHFMKGQAFLRYFLTGKKNYDGLPKIENIKDYVFEWGYLVKDSITGRLIRLSHYQNYPFTYYTEAKLGRGGHPPLSDVMSALCNYLFYQKLAWVADVYSYNYLPLFLSAILLAVIYWRTSRIFGSWVGIISVLCLGLYPLFLAERYYNIKDVPQAVFFSLAILTYWRAIDRVSLKSLVWFSIWAGFSLATKLNFIFAAIIIIPWTILYLSWKFDYKLSLLETIRHFLKKYPRFSLYYLCVPVVMLVILVLSWPAVWFNPQMLKISADYYGEIGTSVGRGYSTYAWKYLLFTTPIITLVLFLAGLWSGFRNLRGKQKQFFNLVFIWWLVPLVRVSLPRTSIYGGVRQIMEYIPAMAIIAGVGGQSVKLWLVRKLRLRNNYLPMILIGLCFVPLVIKLISIHPNQGVYFNQLIGGLKGAKERGIPDAGQSLGNEYRQGVDWLNDHAETNAKLGLGYELLSNIPFTWLRNDIDFQNRSKSGPARLGEYVISAVNTGHTRLDWPRMRYLENFLIPVYEVKVDGVSLLKVWKNDEAHTKPGYLEEEEIRGITFEVKGLTTRINLPQTRTITRVEMKVANPESCLQYIDVVGNIELFLDDKSTPDIVLPNTVHDYDGKLVYPKPFFLLAGEKAKALEMNFYTGKDCFGKVKAIRVFGLKNQV